MAAKKPKQSQAGLKRTLRNQAYRALASEHAEEFDALMSSMFFDAGLAYEPVPTPLQKARQQLEILLEEFPELAHTPNLYPKAAEQMEQQRARVVEVEEDGFEVDLAVELAGVDEVREMLGR